MEACDVCPYLIGDRPKFGEFARVAGEYETDEKVDRD
jgi:hypothetical protein